MEQTNEQKGLKALVNPSPITIGKLARLELIKSPLVGGDFKDLNECLKALYVLELPAADVEGHLPTLTSDALAFAETLTHDEYKSKMQGLVDSLCAWWDMLPRPDEDAKKNDTATDGSSSLSNGAVEPTATT
jgi:hypothetical protein